MSASLSSAVHCNALSNVHATYLIIFMQSVQENEGFISRMRPLLINFTKSEMFRTRFIS